MRYDIDENFKTIYANNTITQIARATGEKAVLEIGDRMNNGFILTQEFYNQLEKNAEFEIVKGV